MRAGCYNCAQWINYEKFCSRPSGFHENSVYEVPTASLKAPRPQSFGLDGGKLDKWLQDASAAVQSTQAFDLTKLECAGKEASDGARVVMRCNEL